ncbi:uncharacterized protein VTP21DRAFT_2 [Calcarisporiella thermophila]|uniref:uncharacterized protein n=1 Tax=Calcarisporiella thermophila TaxID=911321 RepID=UPI0037443FF0
MGIWTQFSLLLKHKRVRPHKEDIEAGLNSNCNVATAATLQTENHGGQGTMTSIWPKLPDELFTVGIIGIDPGQGQYNAKEASASHAAIHKQYAEKPSNNDNIGGNHVVSAFDFSIGGSTDEEAKNGPSIAFFTIFDFQR